VYPGRYWGPLPPIFLKNQYSLKQRGLDWKRLLKKGHDFKHPLNQNVKNQTIPDQSEI